MKLKNNITTSENGFIFNPATGDSFSGNDMATEIVSAMKTGMDVPQIKAMLLNKYEVTPAQLDRDWDDWSHQLREANLLQA